MDRGQLVRNKDPGVLAPSLTADSPRGPCFPRASHSSQPRLGLRELQGGTPCYMWPKGCGLGGAGQQG